MSPEGVSNFNNKDVFSQKMALNDDNTLVKQAERKFYLAQIVVRNK